MIELIIAVCMSDAPERCKNVRLNFEGERVSVQQCSLYSQMEMAKWVGEHPNWTIKKYTCRKAGEYADL